MIMSTWIETPRLVIRTFEPRDAEAWIALVNDPAVTRARRPEKVRRGPGMVEPA